MFRKSDGHRGGCCGGRVENVCRDSGAVVDVKNDEQRSSETTKARYLSWSDASWMCPSRSPRPGKSGSCDASTCTKRRSVVTCDILPISWYLRHAFAKYCRQNASSTPPPRHTPPQFSLRLLAGNSELVVVLDDALRVSRPRSSRACCRTTVHSFHEAFGVTVRPRAALGRCISASRVPPPSKNGLPEVQQTCSEDSRLYNGENKWQKLRSTTCLLRTIK